MGIKQCNNVMDFRRLAKRNLPAPVFHYLDGGADDEWTLRRNTDAFDDYELLPSQLSDVSSIDLKTTLFGESTDWPVMISPTGASKLFHRDGEVAVVRAAEKIRHGVQLVNARHDDNRRRCSGEQWSENVSGVRV